MNSTSRPLCILQAVNLSYFPCLPWLPEPAGSLLETLGARVKFQDKKVGSPPTPLNRANQNVRPAFDITRHVDRMAREVIPLLLLFFFAR